MSASNIEKAIDVNVPVRTAYNQWTQFEEFPKFMDDVVEVTQVDEKKLHWRTKVAGKEAEWDAVITEQIPDARIAWRSVEGTENAGVVTFHRVSDNNTRVMLQMQYSPEGLAENAADAMGLAARSIEKSLKKFKEFIEARGKETGAWRGEIPQEKK